MAGLSNYRAHQVREVVPCLPTHESTGVGEARDVLDVGLQERRVCLQHHEDEGRQELVSAGGGPFGLLEDGEDVFAAAHDAGQLVLSGSLAVHLYDVWKKMYV